MTETTIEKDTIHVKIGDDHSFNCSVATIGRTGENSVSQLEIEIPEELSKWSAYLEFKKPNGETLRTARLDIEGNVIEYDVPSYLLERSGNLETQFLSVSEGGEIWKSASKKYVVLKSIDAVDDIPVEEKEDFFYEAQKLLDEIREEFGNAQATSKIAYIDLLSANWEGDASPYSQVINIDGTTENSKVDINPSIEQLAIFHQKDISFVAENEDGVITVYCVGQKPSADYQMQITITEVIANG